MPGQTSKLTQWRRIGALDMLLLQVIHGLAHGEHAGSSRDAKQLARFAAVIRDMTHAADTGCGPKWAGEKVTLDADRVASLRSLIKEALPHAARLTYEARERLIAKYNAKVSLFCAAHYMMKGPLEALAECERSKAENEKLIREARAASEASRKRRREEWNQIVSDMQSGERYRKYRKLAKEGNAKAVAMFENVGLRVADLAD